MLPRISFSVVAIIFLFAIGCAQTPAPPPDTRPADIQAVKQVEAAWGSTFSPKDADKWVSYFADDASGFYPGAPAVKGKAALKAMSEQFFADPNLAATFQSSRVVASKGGDMVFSEGTCTLTQTNPKTKKPVTDKGKYLTVYMKQPDGSWKAVADAYISDSPM